MKEAFISKRSHSSTDRIVALANQILEEYAAKGYVLTLRQLYYQFVARDLITNTMQSYKRIGQIVNNGRLAGEIDWSMLEDRTRNLHAIKGYSDPATYLRRLSEKYAEDLWKDQDVYCEVWVEKDALIGVVERPCLDLRVPFFACRGYASQSELYYAGKRFSRYARAGKRCVVFHLGDHDPSGMDMTRDNDERLAMFSRAFIDVRRLALNAEQIRQYNLPPNPAKLTDSRAGAYVQQHGDDSWELDALAPSVIDALLRENITKVIDKPKMNAAFERENEHMNDIQRIADDYATALAAVK